MKKAQDMGLLREQEVITLASIVDEETNDESEMPKVANMYINRLNDGMRLQADPTVKFATGNFKAKRIYKEMLSADSPYNTYRHKDFHRARFASPPWQLSTPCSIMRTTIICICVPSPTSVGPTILPKPTRSTSAMRRTMPMRNKRGIQ